MLRNFSEEIARLKTEAAQRETLRYADGFKDRAVELVGELKEADWTQTRMSADLDIPWATLRRWRDDATGAGGDDESASIRPVEVVDGASEGTKITLVSPSAWRIEGLTVDQAVEAVPGAGMMGSNRKVRGWDYPKPCDLRKGHNGLSGLPVEVVAADSSGSADGIALVSPSGWRIEGLTAAEEVEAARRLG